MAKWCPPIGNAWGNETELPRATFKIMNQGNLVHCVSIIFEDVLGGSRDWKQLGCGGRYG